MAVNKELRRKLCHKVFNTKEGAELLSLLYEEELLANKDFLSVGRLSRQVGRSDLILDFFVCAECTPVRHNGKKVGVEEQGIDDTTVKEHHFKTNESFFERG